MACRFAASYIDQYRESVGGENLEVEAFHNSRAQGKRELQSLLKTTQKLKLQITSLSVEAKKALPTSWTSVIRKYIDLDKREFVKGVQFTAIETGINDLGEVLAGAESAAEQGARRLSPPRPSKHWNPSHFLACGMAETLGGILRVKVAMAEEVDSTKRKATSANYWRLLKLAFELAGAEPVEDLRPIMRAGRALAGPRAGFDSSVMKIGVNRPPKK